MGSIVDMILESRAARVEEALLAKRVTLDDLLSHCGSDGKLDLAEFTLMKLQALGRISTDDIEACEKHFKNFDVDNDGFISVEEVMAERLGRRSTTAVHEATTDGGVSGGQAMDLPTQPVQQEEWAPTVTPAGYPRSESNQSEPRLSEPRGVASVGAEVSIDEATSEVYLLPLGDSLDGDSAAVAARQGLQGSPELTPRQDSSAAESSTAVAARQGLQGSPELTPHQESGAAESSSSQGMRHPNARPNAMAASPKKYAGSSGIRPGMQSSAKRN